VPEASQELVEALRASPAVGRVTRPGKGSGGSESDGVFDPAAETLGAKIDIETPKRVGIPMGQQNTGFWEIACSHAGRGLPPSAAVKALVETVQACEAQGEIEPSWPWELDDLADIVERAYLWKAQDRASFKAFTSKITWQ
jgi:hypothetical protein